MSQPWFRMYHEFAGDAVVQSLAFEDQRHYVMVLCFKASGLLDRDFPSSDHRHRVICKALGLDPVSGAEARRRLSDLGLVDADWQPPSWDRRQYKSDNSTARVKAWRGRKSSPTTPPEESKKETDTDTEGNVTCNVSPPLHESLPMAEWQEWIAHRKARRFPCDDRTLGKQLKLLAKYDTATQRDILDTSIQAGWQGLFPPKGGDKPRPTRYEQLMNQAQAAVQQPPPTTDLALFLGGPHEPR